MLSVWLQVRSHAQLGELQWESVQEMEEKVQSVNRQESLLLGLMYRQLVSRQWAGREPLIRGGGTETTCVPGARGQR